MDTAASLAQALRKVSMHTHSYLPIAAAYCRMLNLREVVDGMVDTRMELSPGMVVQTMVLDVLNSLYNSSIGNCCWDKRLIRICSTIPILRDPWMHCFQQVPQRLLPNWEYRR